MRRVFGLILAGLGAFLLVIAVALRAYIPGQVVKYPIKEYLVTQNVGHGVSYFSPALVRPVTGATIMVTSTVRGDANAGSSSTAVWDQFNYLYDQTNHAEYNYSQRRFAFDRKTAQLQMCCGASVDGNQSVRQTGLVGFLWPMPTAKQTYQVFDSTMNKAWPARYTGTTTVGGITVYRFVETVPRTQIGTLTVPQSFAGYKGNSNVTLPEYYTATNTVFVEPETGTQVNQIQQEHLALDDAVGNERMLLLNASFTDTPQTLQKVVNLCNSARGEIGLLSVTLPLVAGLLGIVLLAVGILLSRARRDPNHRKSSATTPALDPAV